MATFSIRIEKPADALKQVMNDLRSWLDSRKIEPVMFQAVPLDGALVALDIQFRSQEEAVLFEQAFS